MCLFIKKRQRNGFVLKQPYLAFKGTRRRHGTYVSPYRGALLPIGEVITCDVYASDTCDNAISRIDRALHFCTNRIRARYHAFGSRTSTLCVLLLPGSRVWYNKDASVKRGWIDSAADCATDKYVLFETEQDALKWWNRNWRKYS